MNYYCYILYSESLNKHYVGSTSQNPEDRLEQHLNNFYGTTKFTHRASDWTIFLIIECKTRTKAEKLEGYIKSMKSSIYIKNLKKYPEMQQKLIHKLGDI